MKKLSGTYEPKFQRLHYRVNVETTGDFGVLVTTDACLPGSMPLTEATVKLKIDGHGPIRHEVAEGDGPVNALDTALRKALLATYPNLGSMHLVDYKVRVINSAEGTAARVRVVIESADDKDVWATVGVSENIIEASWLALVDAVEYKLFKDEDGLTPRQ